MSRVGSSRRLAALLFATAVASLRGTDEAQPATGIAAAKRDYEEVRAATGAGAQLQRLALPKTETPSLDLRSDLPPPQAALPSASLRREKEKLGEPVGKSKDWLIDALKKPPAQSGDGTAATKHDRLIGVTAEDSDLAVRGEQNQRDRPPSVAETRGEAQRVRPSDVSNPLDHFMAAWMTPQDFKLLNSAPKGDSVDGATALPLAGTLAPPSLSEFTSPTDRSEHRALDANNIGGPAANPYLAAMEAPSPVTQIPRESPMDRPMAAAESFARGTSAPLQLTEATTPSTKSNSPASDFQKAQDDAKYFKQLKRF